jgi:hypothetical protein
MPLLLRIALLAAAVSAVSIDQYPSEIVPGDLYVIQYSPAGGIPTEFALCERVDGRFAVIESLMDSGGLYADAGIFAWVVNQKVSVGQEYGLYISQPDGHNTSGTIRCVGRLVSESAPSQTQPTTVTVGISSEPRTPESTLQPEDEFTVPSETETLGLGRPVDMSTSDTTVPGTNPSHTQLSGTQASSTQPESPTSQAGDTETWSPNPAEDHGPSTSRTNPNPPNTPSTATIAGISAGAGLAGLLLGIGTILLLLYVRKKRKHKTDTPGFGAPYIPEMEDPKWRTESAARERTHEIDGRTVSVVPGPPVEMDASKGGAAM